jgi:hypothetical protein
MYRWYPWETTVALPTEEWSPFSDVEVLVQFAEFCDQTVPSWMQRWWEQATLFFPQQTQHHHGPRYQHSRQLLSDGDPPQ